MDGAEVGHPAQESLTEMLGFERFTQGAEFAIENLYGKPNTPAENFVLQYNYQTIADYYIDTLALTDGHLFFNSQDGRTRGVFHMTETYRSIVFSGIFGAIYDSDENNNKANLMSSILDYLLYRTPNLYPPLNIYVNPENAVITWEAPIYWGISDTFTGFNIYLDDELVMENATVPAYQFTNLEVGQSYTAKVQAIYEEGESDLVSYSFTFIGTEAEEDLELGSKLFGNYPNPFSLSGIGRNSSTNISFSIANGNAGTELTIYNQKGQKVTALINEKLSTGKHSVSWNGKDRNGNEVTSGIYFYKLKNGNYNSMKKMVLIK
jgi:hypothetical protein